MEIPGILINRSYDTYLLFRDLELRRRNKVEKKVATEEQLTEIKRKMKETEDWKTKKQYIIDTVREIVPFFVGLAMVTIGGTYYFYTKS